MSSESSGRSVFYLIDEAQNYGKGANATCSLFHHYTAVHGLGERNLQLHFDNCVGQNLNNIMMQYMAWHCMTGLHTTILVSTMLAGHTKFWCHPAGGTFKRKWRKSRAASMQQLAEVVRASTPGGHNVPQLIPEDAPIFLEWKEFFIPVFCNIPDITQYHHFCFDAAHPGVVYLRKLVDKEEISFQMLRQPGFSFTVGELPMPTPNKGMPLEKQWYLYEKVRPYCPENTADIVCPEPEDPKSANPQLLPDNAGGADIAPAKCARPTCLH